MTGAPQVTVTREQSLSWRQRPAGLLGTDLGLDLVVGGG